MTVRGIVQDWHSGVLTRGEAVSALASLPEQAFLEPDPLDTGLKAEADTLRKRIAAGEEFILVGSFCGIPDGRTRTTDP